MKLPNDVCRCVGTICGKRHLCARYLDSPAGPQTPYADLSTGIKDGACEHYIPHFEVDK